MRKVNALLIFLISSVSITGISFVDGRIWEILFYILGMIAYAIVGIMYSIGLIKGRKEGSDAYAFVLFALILAGYGFYKFLERVRIWILGWPLYVKIIVISVLGVALILIIVYKILLYKHKGSLSDYYE